MFSHNKILWLCFCLLFISCNSLSRPKTELREAGVSQELASYRMQNYSDVTYRLNFIIPENKATPVTSSLQLNLSLKGQTPVILDFKQEARYISNVTVSGNSVEYKFENEHIVIPASSLRKGENRIDISFTAPDQSLNRQDEFLYTLLVPDRARTLFPCFDQPDMKSKFILTLEIPAAWKAIANSPEQNEEILGNGARKKISFKETEPLSTYLFSFVAGKLAAVPEERNGRSITLYHRETDPYKIAQCPEILNEVFHSLDWLEEYTGIPYPFAKYDLIILPGFQYGGMEHTGATLYADKRMFLDKNATINDYMERCRLIAHETAHMWFGDYVTMKWFNDVWTKEVFANYFAARIVSPMYPDMNHALTFMFSNIPSAYQEERTSGTTPIKQELDNLKNAGLVYGNIVYTKSPVVMDMLVRIIGEEAFREGIQKYLNQYAYGNATWEELIQILDKQTSADIIHWSDVWVNKKGRPTITTCIANGHLTFVQEDPYRNGLLWPQFITFTAIDKNGERHPGEIWLDKQETSVPLPAGTQIIIPNSKGTGYGLFKMDSATIRYCLNNLISFRQEEERGAILINLHENLLEGLIPGTVFMQAMLNYLPQEQNPILFSQAMKYTEECYKLFLAREGANTDMENLLWEISTNDIENSRRTMAFKTLIGVADSPEAINRMYEIWENPQQFTACPLSESDLMKLSYELAVRIPDKADVIIEKQKKRISNPDRQKEYAFISQAVSPDKAVRDTLFNNLLQAENRRTEPWAISALSYLNHRLRQKEALAYIRPGLDEMQEIQETGDIFFPRNWAGALLSGHTSPEALQAVELFFKDNPDYPLMLGNKIRQKADHLYRISR